MRTLEIKNFTKAAMDIESDHFRIKYCTDRDDKYVLGIDSIPDSTLRFEPNRHYKLAIHKVKEDGSDNFTVWLWDMNRNMSYPMSIWRDDMASTSKFAKFLKGVLQLADKGEFSGHSGNKITLN